MLVFSKSWAEGMVVDRGHEGGIDPVRTEDVLGKKRVANVELAVEQIAHYVSSLWLVQSFCISFNSPRLRSPLLPKIGNLNQACRYLFIRRRGRAKLDGRELGVLYLLEVTEANTRAHEFRSTLSPRPKAHMLLMWLPSCES